MLMRVYTSHLGLLLAGMGRANLAKWVAAASVIQRCVRGWLFRRRMRQWLAGRVEAAVVLQACWRGRQARAQLEQLAGSCITIQVSLVSVSNTW